MAEGWRGALVVGLIVLFILLHGRDPTPQYLNVVVVYRGMWLIVLYIFLSGLNVFVWEKYNINYLNIFGVEIKSGPHYIEFFEAAAYLALIWSLGILVFLGVTRSGVEAYGLGTTPLAVAFIFWVILFSPTNMFYKNTRYWVWQNVRGFFLGPFAVVNFASCWVADQFTSATIALVDFEYTTCHYVFDIANINCDSLHKWLQPACVAFPFAWRLQQCARQYLDSGQRSHLLNAGKYAASLVAISMSSLHLITQVDPNAWSVYRGWWVVAITLSTIYSYIWDIVMDWGFVKRHPVTKRWSFLRETLIYDNPLIYYFVMVSNLLMRCSWLITLNPDYFGIHFKRDILVFFLSSLELVRRIQWNFFRMEYEHINRFGAVKYSTTNKGHSDEELIEETDLLQN